MAVECLFVCPRSFLAYLKRDSIFREAEEKRFAVDVLAGASLPIMKQLC